MARPYTAGIPSQLSTSFLTNPLQHFTPCDRTGATLDGKAKKRLEVIKQKLQVLRQKLAGAKKQEDEPGEVKGIEAEIAKLEAEATQLRAS